MFVHLTHFDSLARRQHGLVARHQADVSDSAWRRAIAAGTLIELHRGVVRLVGTSDTPEQRILAAVLAAGPGAMASHRSAAHLHGVPGAGARPVDVVIPRRSADDDGHVRGRRVNRLAGVELHRPRDLDRTVPHRIDSIPCTNLLRTLLDLGAVAPHLVHGAVGHSLTNDLASIAAIETALLEHARKGRHGVTALRCALDDWAIDAKPADSVLEPAMRRLVERYDLPPVEFHARIGGREVDFHVLGTPIVIECDGWRYHGRDRDQFERDRRNDAEFAAHGWIVLRFTYRRITRRAGEVADQIRRTIDRWTNPDAA